MICPVCNSTLAEARHSGLQVMSCQTCHGMWFTNQDLARLENEVFDWKHEAKGTLIASSSETNRKCPRCSKLMKRFHYRSYALELEFCEDGHGFWLDAGEDKRVLELMRKEEAGIHRSEVAEDKWTSFVRHLHSNPFLDRFRGPFQ